MKVVVPVTINDSNMTSDAVDETYPVWRGDEYQSVQYGVVPTAALYKVVVNDITGDMWGCAYNRGVYRRGSSEPTFALVATIGSSGEYIYDIAINPYSGWVYVVYRTTGGRLTLMRINPSTYEVAGPLCEVAGSAGYPMALDTFTGNVFLTTSNLIYKYTDATGVLALHATVSETSIAGIAINPNTKDLWVSTRTPYNILKQAASSGAFSEIASDVDYYNNLLVAPNSGDVFAMYTPGFGNPSEVFRLKAGDSAFVSVGLADRDVLKASESFGVLYFTFSSHLTKAIDMFSNTAFSEGDYVIYGTDIYLALVDSVNAVPGTDASKWFLHSSLNRLRMFDSQLTTKTEVSGMNLIVSFTSNEIDTIGLFNVVGASVTVIVTNGWGVVESSTQAVSTRNVVFENLPSNINAVYQVIITPLNGVASCGNMVAGMSNAIGTLMRDVELSLVSYSKTTIDDFGRPSFTVRGRAKKLECAMLVEKADSNRVYELFNQNDAKLCMWVGPPGYPHLTVFGWYQRFELQLGAADTAKYNLEIQGDVDTLATETSPSLATPGALEIVEAYLSVEGDGVFLMFNRAAYIGAGGSGGVVVTIGETVYPLTYVSGDGTNAFLFEFSGAFVYDETAVVDYTQPGNGIEDSDGEDLVVSTPVPLDLLYGGVHPTVVSTTVEENGTTVTIVFDLPVSIGSGGSGGFTLNGAALTYVSGLPGNTAVFSVAKILQGVTVTAEYVQPGDGIEQVASGLDLLSFSGVGVVNNSGTAPASIVSASVNAAGNQLTVVFSEAMSQGAGYQNTDINLDGSLGGTNIGLTYVSGSGTDTWVFSIATVIRKNETVDLDYNGRPDGIEDASGNDLAEVIDMTVTNNSENTGESYDDILFWDGFEGLISGLTYEATNNDYPLFHTASIVSGVTLNQTIKAVGSKSLRCAVPTNGGGVLFTLAQPLSAEMGRVGFWSNCNGVGGGNIITLKNSVSSIYLYMYNNGTTPNNLYVGRRVSDAYVYDPNRVTVTLPKNRINTWVFFELAWNRFTFGTKLLIDGEDTSLTGRIPTAEWPGVYDQVALASLSGLNVNSFTGYFDNLMISTDSDRDLYALAMLEACPRV